MGYILPKYYLIVKSYIFLENQVFKYREALFLNVTILKKLPNIHKMVTFVAQNGDLCAQNGDLYTLQSQ